MGLGYDIARSGNYELKIFEFLGPFTYEIVWHTESALTVVGKGSERYSDVHDTRYAAVLHLANILPKARSERLICSQAELVWECWPDRNNR
jgi:hypothetical protein